MTQCATDIHGHEVMKMMLESGKSFSVDQLEAEIIKQFGIEARFCTCSEFGMTALQLIRFLAEKGKFVPKGEGFSTEPSMICDH